MRHSKKPLDDDGSKSSLVTESSELLTEETTLKDDGEKASPKSTSRELAAVQDVAPPASTRNSGKRLSRRFKGMALQEYHGQAWPSSVMDRSSKARRQQEQPRQDYESKHSGRAQASAALVERDTEQRVQERMASNDAEEWKTGRSRGALSTSCTTLVPRGASTPTEVPERQHSSATVSEANTEYNVGDNPDSLGMQDRRKPNILLFDSLVNHDKSSRSNTPVPWKFRDIGTSPFLPHSRGYMEFSRRPTVSYPESLMDVASSPRSTELDASIIVCVVVAVLLVTLLAITLFAWNKLRYDDYSAVTDSVNEDVCFNAACEMVVTLLGKSQDPSVPPCKDFYRHTCGRWYDKSSRRASYAIENRNDFHARVHHNLERMASATAFSNSSTYQMALFYSSCHRFKHEQRITPVEGVLNISRIDVHQWLTVTSFPELLATIVTECLRTGLVSVISVKRGEGQRIYVDKGEALVSILTGYRERVAYFVKDALAALGLNRNYTLATAIVALDSTIEWFNSTAPSEYHSVVVHDLPPQGFVLAWVLGLNRGLHNRTKVHGPTPLFARRLPEIWNVMWTLSSVDLNLASVYSLLLPLAQIMSYAAPLGAQELVGESDEIDVCLRVTAERFRMNFPTWVAQTIETPEIHGYVGVMVNALESVATEHPDIQKDLVLNATDFAEMQINTTCKILSLPK
ncbi:uncharacterized protein LOC142802813 [Rhipicephalus microplus]|uniref:uncharacterized protein LOC142794406 n=1 Tax=Rhipicephalus microplus TaxID=6941 RepID=UPI003F6C3509